MPEKPLGEPSVRLGRAAELLGVSPDTVRRWADGGKLRTTRTSGGHRRVRAVDLAAFARRRAREVARRAPPSVVAARGSARNRMTGIVTKVVRDRVAAQIEMQAGPFRLVALTTREAADDLALRPGSIAVATVKATNVIVELPGDG